MISAEAAGALAVLALTDSLSFGTLLVPVWLLMTPGRVRPHRILLYLGTVAAVYYGIGIALMAGGRFVIDSAAGCWTPPPRRGGGVQQPRSAVDHEPAAGHERDPDPVVDRRDGAQVEQDAVRPHPPASSAARPAPGACRNSTSR
ncbi:hypothetical protein GS563_28475 [Rhodococcus hoagii]|nr:hypothetical protein [Prescottella equi]